MLSAMVILLHLTACSGGSLPTPDGAADPTAPDAATPAAPAAATPDAATPAATTPDAAAPAATPDATASATPPADATTPAADATTTAPAPSADAPAPAPLAPQGPVYTDPAASADGIGVDAQSIREAKAPATLGAGKPGTGVKIAGTFEYAGSKKGVYRVDITAKKDGKPYLAQVLLLNAPEPWSTELPKGLGTVDIAAYIDVDGKGRGPTDPGADAKGVDVSTAPPTVELKVKDP